MKGMKERMGDMGECKLIRLEIENFLRVKGLVIEADGKHVVIRGKNGSGKTSAVDALWLALAGGKSGRKLEEPIHDGAKRARVVVDVGEYKVERRWTKSGPSIFVWAEDGKQVRNPTEVLEGMISTAALDPVRFLEMRPQDQLDQVLAIAGVKHPVGRVREITGEDLSPRDGESADQWLLRLGGDEGEFFIRRRLAHRVALDKKAALDDADEILIRMGGAPNESEMASPSELLGRLEDLNARADVKREKSRGAAEAQGKHKEAKRKLEGLRTERISVAEKISELHSALNKMCEEAETLDNRIEKGAGIVKDLEIQAADAQGEADRCEDPSQELAEVRAALAGIESENESRVKRLLQAETVRRLAEERERADQEHSRLDGILEALRGLRKGLLEGIDLGVKGLAVGNGELTLNGHPFAQGSQAERLRVAIGVAVRTAPKLKLLRIDDGEHLDGESRAMVFAEAERHGFQVVMTAVADGGDGLGVEIVDVEGDGNGMGREEISRGAAEARRTAGRLAGALTVGPEDF